MGKESKGFSNIEIEKQTFKSLTFGNNEIEKRKISLL